MPSDDGWGLSGNQVSTHAAQSGFGRSSFGSSAALPSTQAPMNPEYNSTTFGYQAIHTPVEAPKKPTFGSGFGSQNVPPSTQAFGHSSFGNQVVSAPPVVAAPQYNSTMPSDDGWGLSGNQVTTHAAQSGFGRSSFGSSAAPPATQAPRNPEHNSTTFGYQAIHTPVEASKKPTFGSGFGSQNVPPSTQAFGQSSFGNQVASARPVVAAPNKCHNCGGEGHYSKECPEPKRERPPLTCHNCQQVGHTLKECSEPLKPREDGKPPSTFIPEDENEESLFSCGVAQGGMFTRLFEAEMTVTGGGVGSMKPCAVEKIESFDQLRLGERVYENLKHCGYTRPTPVQQCTMPLIRNGFDVAACAQTGSGKTAAYLLPIISRLSETEDYSNAGEGSGTCYPRAVVIVPTRELAVQVYNETRKYAYGTVITCKAVYGGTAVGYQKDELRKGASIIAATIGRFKHFVDDGTISLDKLRFFVLDEVDRLLEQDSEQIITSLHNKINNKDVVQGIMFSATLPVEVQSQAALLLKPDYKMVTVDAIGTANKCIQQDIECIDQKDKKDRLLTLLDIDKNKYSIDPNSTIYQQKILIFVSKKGFADTLASIVSQSGLPATTIHADRLQNERSEAMKDFIFGKKAVMIATAVAERGLDIRGVDHVINYDLPDDIHQYIHRIGRTGRRGNPGRATSFYLPEKDKGLAAGLKQCLITAEQVVPDWLLQEAKETSLGFGQTAEENDSW